MIFSVFFVAVENSDLVFLESPNPWGFMIQFDEHFLFQNGLVQVETNNYVDVK